MPSLARRAARAMRPTSVKSAVAAQFLMVYDDTMARQRPLSSEAAIGILLGAVSEIARRIPAAWQYC